MFRIGEFSKFVRVSARILRHYNKCGLFQPAEIDKMTGYRFYSAKQIPMLNQIIALRDNGFTGVGVMYDIIIKEVPQIKVLSLRENIRDYRMEDKLWGKLYSIILEN